jgi:hypothetical protein
MLLFGEARTIQRVNRAELDNPTCFAHLTCDGVALGAADKLGAVVLQCAMFSSEGSNTLRKGTTIRMRSRRVHCGYCNPSVAGAELKAADKASTHLNRLPEHRHGGPCDAMRAVHSYLIILVYNRNVIQH